jgi:anti-sigma28 factor (negative regulator of flagellin synthesis)
MRNSNTATDQNAGDDSMHAAAMAGMHLAHVGRRKLDPKLCEAQAWAGEVEKAQFAEAVAAGDVRSEVVEKLRTAMTTGKYRVSSADVAAKLMGTMLR